MTPLDPPVVKWTVGAEWPLGGCHACAAEHLPQWFIGAAASGTTAVVYACPCCGCHFTATFEWLEEPEVVTYLGGYGPAA